MKIANSLFLAVLVIGASTAPVPEAKRNPDPLTSPIMVARYGYPKGCGAPGEPCPKRDAAPEPVAAAIAEPRYGYPKGCGAPGEPCP
jgi:hypothetical protein